MDILILAWCLIGLIGFIGLTCIVFPAEIAHWLNNTLKLPHPPDCKCGGSKPNNNGKGYCPFPVSSNLYNELAAPSSDNGIIDRRDLIIKVRQLEAQVTGYVRAFKHFHVATSTNDGVLFRICAYCKLDIEDDVHYKEGPYQKFRGIPKGEISL